MNARPAFFFDRDGVVNVSPGAGYVLSWDAFHFSPGVIESLAFLKSLGYALVLVTSQQGVGKKLMTQADLDDIHAHMQAELAKHDATFDAIYSCTCLASDPDCTCRKPSTEMIVKAAAAHHVDVTQSWMIGDHDRDIVMGLDAGVPRTIRIESPDHPSKVQAEFTLADTSQLLPLLQAQLKPLA